MAGVKGRSGGPRKNAGGARKGAGRKPHPLVRQADVQIGDATVKICVSGPKRDAERLDSTLDLLKAAAQQIASR